MYARCLRRFYLIVLCAAALSAQVRDPEQIYKDAIALLVLLVILWVRPSGIFGSAEESELKKF